MMCIVLNTICLALDSHNISEEMGDVLSKVNDVNLITFMYYIHIIIIDIVAIWLKKYKSGIQSRILLEILF